MICRRIEEMIPLYVEGDLDTDRAELVSAHLKSCDACSELAGGFNESQEWLHSYTPPAFDSTFFDGLRNGVLSRIENERARPSFFQLIATRWRFDAALAAALLLLVIGGLVFYGYHRGTGNDKTDIVQDPTRPQEAPAPQKGVSAPDGPRVAVEKHRHRRRSLRDAVAKAVEPPKTELEPGFPKFEKENPAIPGIESTAVSQTNTGQGEIEPWKASLPITDSKTRIEIQTSDPTIRIIWFAPNVDTNSGRRSSDS